MFGFTLCSINLQSFYFVNNTLTNIRSSGQVITEETFFPILFYLDIAAPITIENLYVNQIVASDSELNFLYVIG